MFSDVEPKTFEEWVRWVDAMATVNPNFKMAMCVVIGKSLAKAGYTFVKTHGTPQESEGGPELH